jgi:hypothetical protein
MKHFALVGLLLPVVAVACSEPASSDLSQDESALRQGAPSLVMPLIDEDQKLLSRFNDKATAKGLEALPDVVEIKKAADADRVEELRGYFNDEVMDAVGAKVQAMPAWGPDSFTMSGPPGLCYRGDPLKVVDFMSDVVAGRALSEQLIIHGWRYKDVKNIGGDIDSSEDVDDVFPAIWKEWRGTGEAILVISSTNDDGDEFSDAIIPRCRQ